MREKIGLISSFVIDGYVGLRAAVPAVQILGAYPLVVPTVIYTTHAGVRGAKGEVINSSILDFSLAYLFEKKLNCLITGFLGTELIGKKVLEYLEEMKRKKIETKIIVDPILGDFPKGLYVSPVLAELTKEKLIKLAYAITPNKYEAQYLSGMEIKDKKSALEVVLSLHSLGPEVVVITSYRIDYDKKRIYDLVSFGRKVYEISCPLITDKSTSGAGDMYSALLGVLLSQRFEPYLAAAVSSALVNRSVFLANQMGGGSVNPIDSLTPFISYFDLKRSEEEIKQFLASLDVTIIPL
ncbi:MAG TPA: hypothetical protein GXX38_06575 [Clostridia bacterium]|nr:hypothetical protein [Clostridia bacterium]